jgi:hypothetical protein
MIIYSSIPSNRSDFFLKGCKSYAFQMGKIFWSICFFRELLQITQKTQRRVGGWQKDLF